jgi:hypothetical protein
MSTLFSTVVTVSPETVNVVSCDTGWMVGQKACVVRVLPLKANVPVDEPSPIPPSYGIAKRSVKQPPEMMYVSPTGDSGPASPQA